MWITLASWATKAFLVSIVLSACSFATGSPPTQTTAPPVLSPTLKPAEAPTQTPTLTFEEPPPARAQQEFTTNLSKHSVPYDEILSGGPPKDGIPAIDAPQFVSVEEADQWLENVEPVICFQIGADVRAYPIQILIWHEIVNDTVDGVPVVVTFCPLCNTAIAFERRFDQYETTFGTTGRLRFSNLIMYDRATETWWQQATGEAIAGTFTGEQLTFLPASIIAWADFKAAHPTGKVLSRDTGFARDYGRNPYVGYDNINNPPFLYQGPATPGVLPPVARVLTIDLDGEAVAYPYDVLQKVMAVNDTVGGTNVVVLWATGTASALDRETVAGGADVGTATAFARELDGHTLTFSFDGSHIVDDETGSEWNVLGQAINGPLGDKALTPVVAVNHFWFSWAAFKPQTRIFQSAQGSP